MEDHEEESQSRGEEEEEEQTIALPGVVTKYKAAAEIVNRVIPMVILECIPGKNILELCQYGDDLLTREISRVYNKKNKQVEKGIAFPTCISVNNCVAHFSPYPPDDTVLHVGDLVKIDMACHIDGFIASLAQTIVISGGAPITGRKADVIMAAYHALEAAIRMLRPSTSNYAITETIARIATAYHCKPLEGVISHNCKQFVADANKGIMLNPTIEHHVEECQIAENDVFSIDIVMSTGEGRARENECRPTVFKRAVEQQYQLKMRSSRALFHEIDTKFPAVPFTLRMIEAHAPRFGITEMMNHGLLHEYPVLFERDGEFVAQFKATCLVLPSQTHKITATFLPPDVQSEFSITDEQILNLLRTGPAGGKKKKKAKKVTTTETPAPSQ